MNSPDDLIITRSLRVPLSAIRFRFSRSGGHGGQNVNKVETRVEALLDIAGAPFLTDHQRARLLDRLRARLDGEGVLHVVADSSRSQWENRQEAISRCTTLLRQAMVPPKPRTATRPTLASRHRKLDQKKRRSGVKSGRRRVDPED